MSARSSAGALMLCGREFVAEKADDSDVSLMRWKIAL